MIEFRDTMTACMYRLMIPGLFTILFVLAAPALCAQTDTSLPKAVQSDSSSQTKTQQSDDATSAEAAVTVLNRKVATFRSSLRGVSPASRAERSRKTLNEILNSVETGTVTVNHEPQGNVLLVDGKLAFILLPNDVDAVRSETLDSITIQTVSALEQVIAEAKEAQDRKRLLRNFGHWVLATLIFCFAVWLVFRIRKWLSRHLARMFQSGAANIQLGGARLLAEERVSMLAQGAGSIIAWLIILLMSYEWLSFSLRLFPYTRPWGEQLNQYLIGVALQIGSSIIHALPNLLIALIIFALARTTIRMLAPFFDRLEAGTAHLGSIDRDTAKPTRWIFSVGVWLFAIVMAYPYLPGSQSDAFRGMSVLVGLMVSVGGASLLGQAASGLVLMYSRTLRIGEYVRINDHEGTVTELRTFTTRIRTGLGEELTLPNALVLSTVTKNYSRTVVGKGYIVDTVVTIGYDTPWRQVEAMLMEAAAKTSGIIAEPPPRVFQTALSDFYPEYKLVCQAVPSEPRPRAEVLAQLHANIQDVFNEYGVQIMSPHYLGDPDDAKIVPKSMWFAAPAKSDIPVRADRTPDE